MTFSALRNRIKKLHILPILSIGMVIFGLVMRWYWLSTERIPFHSDEAIVGLMARHILSGERPIFFYGQAYMGSLDAWMNALVFQIFGESILAMRSLQCGLWLVLLASIYRLSSVLFRSNRAGWYTVILLACPPVNVVLYTTASLGGYSEALILGIWSLILAVTIARKTTNLSSTAKVTQLFLPGFLIGLIAGFGLWAFGFSLVFTIPALLISIISILKNQSTLRTKFFAGIFILMGLLVGGSFWIGYAIENGMIGLLSELAGSAVAVEKTNLLETIGLHFVSFFLLGIPAALGFRPPWNVEWLVLPILPMVGIAWGWLLYRCFRDAGERLIGLTLISPLVLLFLVFLLTPFGVDPSGRYFLLFSILLPVCASGVLLKLEFKKWWCAAGLVLLLTGYQTIGSIQAERQSPSGITTQFAPGTEIDHKGLEEVIHFLMDEGETRGYTTYWLAYTTAFRSDEEIILIPRLPYHRDFRYTTRDDRYLPYTRMVSESEKTAFLTYQFPELDEQIRKLLLTSSITWEEKRIGEYTVFYRLSESLAPSSLETLYRN